MTVIEDGPLSGWRVVGNIISMRNGGSWETTVERERAPYPSFLRDLLKGIIVPSRVQFSIECPIIPAWYSIERSHHTILGTEVA
ncbi:hypothetical protein GOBAR_DD18167 [Gossypium barbadense]|nr:hypothetical protein GOBAR_DD18167 [Gossypium barbadense]